MRHHRFFFSLGVATLALLGASNNRSAATSPEYKRSPNSEKADDLEVRFSMPRASYRVGEVIPLRIELYNRSKSPVLLTKEIPGVNVQGSSVSLDVSIMDTAHHESPRMVKTAHPSPVTGLSDAEAIINWWVLLRPQEFYGSRLEIKPDDFEFLKQSGKYRLHLKFTSLGGYPPTIAERLANSEPSTPRVSYRTWTGTITWDSDWFQVGPQK